MTTLECIASRSFARLHAMARRVGCFVREGTPTPLNARVGDIVVFVANADGMPARVTRPRYMCCVKRCEVGTRSVFDTGAVRLLRAAAMAFVVQLG